MLALGFRQMEFSEANTIMIYLLAVLLSSYIANRKIYALYASLLSVLLFNFFFTEPYYLSLIHICKKEYLVYSAGTLEEAETYLNQSVNLVILDINLPDGDGREFLKKVRGNNPVPVLLLTARDTEQDMLQLSLIHILLLSQNSYAVVLLDLMLPGISGEEVLKEIRQRGKTPVIVLTAKDTIDDLSLIHILRGQSQLTGNGKRITFSRNTDQKAVGGTKSLHVKLTGGILHARGRKGVDL